MDKVLNAAQIKTLDRAAVEAGIPAGALMESAGAGVARIVARSSPGRNIVTVSGKGGNGGDALVAARLLARMGFRVRAFVTAPVDELGPTTGEKARALAAAWPEVLNQLADIGELKRALQTADCVIDGLLGIGVDRPLSGMYLEIVREINRASALRVAIDLPTGIPSDSGAVIGEAVHADITACMAAYKPAHLLYPARGVCGRIEVVPVGYPETLWDEIAPIAYVTDRNWVRDHLPVRPPAGHKGTFGRVLIVAGSVGMSGAAIMCTLGALRAGTGLVTVACPESILPIVAAAVPEALTLPLPEADGHLGLSAVSQLEDAISHADVVAIGPGLGRTPKTGEFVRSLLKKVRGRIVLDADALFGIATDLSSLKNVAGRAVLTPHPGEMARLTDLETDKVDAERIEIARSFAQTHGVTLLLKGRPTAIGTPDGAVTLNPTGNTGLATGGSGDVLTGIIAGLLAGGATPDEAAILGAYLHGYTADYLARDRAERAIIPRDLIATLPHAIKEVEDDSS